MEFKSFFLGRMALLVTLFLVLVNIFNNVTTNTPKAEGLTAIEAWMLACILFVFATLAEYAGLLFHKMNLFIGTKEKTKGGSYVVRNKLKSLKVAKLKDDDRWWWNDGC